MEIRIRPELEEMIRQDVQRGSYETVDEFVEQAVSILHEREAWLADHRTEIEAKISDGYAAAQRGELIESDDVRKRLTERKRTWSREQQQG